MPLLHEAASGNKKETSKENVEERNKRTQDQDSLGTVPVTMKEEPYHVTNKLLGRKEKEKKKNETTPKKTLISMRRQFLRSPRLFE